MSARKSLLVNMAVLGTALFVADAAPPPQYLGFWVEDWIRSMFSAFGLGPLM